jgi:hypothetical protein
VARAAERQRELACFFAAPADMSMFEDDPFHSMEDGDADP